MSRATFGDFLRAAHDGLGPPPGAGSYAPRGSVEEVSRSLLRVVRVMGRYVQDMTAGLDRVGPRARPPLHPWARACLQARQALSNAAWFLTDGGPNRRWPPSPAAQVAPPWGGWGALGSAAGGPVTGGTSRSAWANALPCAASTGPDGSRDTEMRLNANTAIQPIAIVTNKKRIRRNNCCRLCVGSENTGRPPANSAGDLPAPNPEGPRSCIFVLSDRYLVILA